MDDGRPYDGSGGSWLGRGCGGRQNATMKLIAPSLLTCSISPRIRTSASVNTSRSVPSLHEEAGQERYVQ